MRSAQESAGGIQQRSDVCLQSQSIDHQARCSTSPTTESSDHGKQKQYSTVNRNQTGITGAHLHHSQPHLCYLWHIIFLNPKLLVSALYWSDSEPHNGSLTAKTFALLVF